MNTSSKALLLALSLGFALSASPVIAAPPMKNMSGLNMEADVAESQRRAKAPRPLRSSKPKEIVVVGSKAPNGGDSKTPTWHETTLTGTVAL